MPEGGARSATALRIGTFARRASVSVKTLRFYERVGLFRPAYVDSNSGYRYYRLDQLALLRDLRLLRDLGLSVADLKVWVERCDEDGTRLTMLARLRERLREQAARERDRLRFVERWIERARGGTLARPIVPAIRCIPSTPALTIRDRVRAVAPAVYRMFEAAERAAARHEARAERRPFLLWHDARYRDRDADVEVCVPIHRAALTAVGGIWVEGTRSAACLAFEGSYAGAPAAYRIIEQWLSISGARASGPLRETYYRFGADQKGYRLPKRFIARSVEEYRTELQVPIAGRFIEPTPGIALPHR